MPQGLLASSYVQHLLVFFKRGSCSNWNHSCGKCPISTKFTLGRFVKWSWWFIQSFFFYDTSNSWKMLTFSHKIIYGQNLFHNEKYDSLLFINCEEKLFPTINFCCKILFLTKKSYGKCLLAKSSLIMENNHLWGKKSIWHK